MINNILKGGEVLGTPLLA